MTEPTALQPEPPAPKPEDERLLEEAIARGSAPDCLAWLESASHLDAVHALAALGAEERASLLALIPPEHAAEVLELLPESQAIEAVQDLHAPIAAEILAEMASDARADLVQSLDDDDAHAVLAELETEIAHDIRTLVAHDEESAGGMMVTEFVAFRDDMTIRDALADMAENAEKYADYNVQYTYVTDAIGRLRGVLPIRRLLFAKRSSPIGDVMIADPVSVPATMEFDDLRRTFMEHPYIGLPVVSSDGVLLGVVEQEDMAHAAVEEADDLYRQSQGIVGGEELRSMPLLTRSRRRLAWLSANIVLNIIAASVIAMHQDTLEAVIALAVFLPIISDMSGCSGNQAVAVTMRELTLGVTRPRDGLRVLLKEASVGLINGIALGVLIGAVAYLWKGNIALGGVVGVALALNTLVAVCIGGLVPLLLKAFKTDPALASGPILTTITDMCGFLIVLSLASAAMGYLS